MSFPKGHRLTVKHGMDGTPTHRAWMEMRRRCRLKGRVYSKYYADIGVSHCPEWDDFANFYRDMGPRPSPQHSLDRYPDKAGNYEPGNCRWATKEEQSNNLSNNRYVSVGGNVVTIAQAVRLTGKGRNVIYRLAAQNSGVIA